jgi:hypothetical protein
METWSCDWDCIPLSKHGVDWEKKRLLKPQSLKCLSVEEVKGGSISCKNYLEHNRFVSDVAAELIEIHSPKKGVQGLSGKAAKDQIVADGLVGVRGARGVHALNSICIKQQAVCVHAGIDKGAALKGMLDGQNQAVGRGRGNG